MARKNKLDILKEKYKGIRFTRSQFNKQKIHWEWKGLKATGIKYSDLEWNIKYTIETYNRLNPNKKIR